MNNIGKWVLGGLCVFALGVAGFGWIAASVYWQQADITIRRVEIDRKLARTESAARSAQILALHDRAVVFATCRAFHRRDVEDAIHAQIVTDTLRKHAPSLNAFQKANDPEAIRHSKALANIAYGLDCRKLMERALLEAPTPKPVSTSTPTPIASVH